LAARPVRDWECGVVREELRVVLLPYDVVKPYSTWVSADSLVVQDMVAEDDVIEPAEIDEMVGAVVSGGGMVCEHEAVVPPLEPVHCQR
jgi:hypothetical protein